MGSAAAKNLATRPSLARQEEPMETPDRPRSSTAIPRRAFLKTASAVGFGAAAGLEGVLAARRAPAFGQTTRLHLLQWVDFIPEGDTEVRRQLVEYNRQMKMEVTFETINANDLQPRITAAIQSGSGPDIIMMLHNWPHLYAGGLADVTDLAEWKAGEQGDYYPHSGAAARLGKRWLALPHGIVGLQFAYRKSWFDEVGKTSWPKTLDELRQVGMKLKKKGKPIGQTLGHTFGDAPAWSYPLVWGFGGAEVDKTGKKVVLDGSATLESVKFMQAFWKDACDEGGFAWDDTSNNRAFLAGEIAATLNGASIYIAAKRGQEKIKDEKGEPMVKDIQHGPIPNGPAGTHGYHVAFSHAVMRYGKNVKLAKDFLT